MKLLLLLFLLFLLFLLQFMLSLLLLFDLLFRREALRQQLNGFLIILMIGDIERRHVGIEANKTVRLRLDCAIAAKVDYNLHCAGVIIDSSPPHWCISINTSYPSPPHWCIH